MSDSKTPKDAPERRTLADTVTLSWERVGWILLLVGALALRVYNLGHRVMSHDESLHTYYAWKLFDHGEYVHDPMMHGPLLFHGTALMYYIFGDNDFAARMFTVILGMLLVASPLLLRRWLGPAGALIAGLLLTISPNILYYTRYIRHDIHVELFTVLMFVCFVRFVDERKGRWVVLAFASAALAISSAEMAYINGFVLVLFVIVALLAERMSAAAVGRVAMLLAAVGLGLLLFGYLAVSGLLVARFPGMPAFGEPPWKELVQAGILFGGLSVIYAGILRLIAPLHLPPELSPAEEQMLLADLGLEAEPETESEADEDGDGVMVLPGAGPVRRGTVLGDLLFGRRSTAFAGFGLLLLAAGAWLYRGNACLGDMPMANLIVGIEACKLAAGLLASGGVIFVYGFMGWLLEDAGERGLASAIARVPAESLVLAGVLAFAIYALLYTTFFTNPAGISGLTRSVEYWVEQHGVVRGDQPFYYYLLFNPLYEFLPMSFALAAAWVYIQHPALRVWRGSGAEMGAEPTVASAYFVPGLLAWAAGVFWIYSWAGEKMPWLVTHLVVPQIFLAARLLSDTIEVIDWEALRGRVWALAGLSLVLFAALAVQLARLLYSDAGWPVATSLLALAFLAWLGRRLWRLQQEGRQAELAVTAILALAFLLGGQLANGLLLGVAHAMGDLPAAVGGLGGTGLAQALLGLAILAGLIYAVLRTARGLPGLPVRLLASLVLAALLLVVTARVSFMANFVNDELATEYLVYAHATDDGNVMLDRLKALQARVGDRDLVIGYDNEVSWPYTWYFRTSQWKQARYLGDKPSGSAQLRELDVVIVGSPNYGNFEDYLVRDYNAYEYDRMWWPNEGYKGYKLDRDGLQRLVDNLYDPEMRRNLLDIVIKRKYRQDPHLPATPENAKSLDNWFHHAKMKLWVRKDLDDQAGVGDAGQAGMEPTATPAFAVTDALELDVDLRYERDVDGKPIVAPKGIAVDDAGRLYVVDHENARILIFDAEGRAIGELAAGELRDTNGAPSAWGVGVAPDGSAVYVADTWNHRVLKFVDGQQTAQWGTFGTPPSPGEALDLMYGPRDVAVDAQGRVYVADTGNKRISIFDADGNGIGFIGGPGLEPGQFDEPSSVAIDPATGNIFVADLWNLRVQVFDADRRPIRSWPVDGWTSLDAQHKAYIDVHPAGFVVFSDPEKSRVWLYDTSGNALGVMSLPMDDYGLDQPIGIAFDAQGRIYVSASQGNVVTRYGVPASIAAALGGAPADAGGTPDVDASPNADGAGADGAGATGAGAEGDEAAAESDAAAGDSSADATVSGATATASAAGDLESDADLPVLPSATRGGG
ncbi:MAG: TIGR03663 family protein [Chloroflexi bacterium]|nr:TIGR03663 family protein [Chloroflexota bacterium]